MLPFLLENGPFKQKKLKRTIAVFSFAQKEEKSVRVRKTWRQGGSRKQKLTTCSFLFELTTWKYVQDQWTTAQLTHQMESEQVLTTVAA